MIYSAIPQLSNPPFDFPVSLTEKYRPRTMAEFVGLAKPKALCAKLAANPFPSAWLFVGPSGTGKTTMAIALASLIPAEVHHIPSQECDLANLERVCRTCNYVPMMGKKMHLILVDEADQMSPAAQLFLLSVCGCLPCSCEEPCEACGAVECKCEPDVCIAGNPARNGKCGRPDCVCAPNSGRQLNLFGGAL